MRSIRYNQWSYRAKIFPVLALLESQPGGTIHDEEGAGREGDLDHDGGRGRDQTGPIAGHI